VVSLLLSFSLDPPPPPPTPPPTQHQFPVEPPSIAALSSLGLSKSARRRLRQKKVDAWTEAAVCVQPSAGSGPAKPTKVAGGREEGDPAQKLDRARLPKTWAATNVSCRLVMFHVLFLRMFRLKCRGASTHSGPIPDSLRTHSEPTPPAADEEEADVQQLVSVAEAKAALDVTFGRATASVSRQFQTSVKRIMSTPDWGGFFARCLLPMLEPTFLVHWLQRAALNSARRHTHTHAHTSSLVSHTRTHAHTRTHPAHTT
jgi:hypothetical protein